MRAGTRVSPRASIVFAPRGARAARAPIFVPSIPRAACGPGSASLAPTIQSTRPRLAGVCSSDARRSRAPRVGGTPGRGAGGNARAARRRPAVQEDLMALRKAARVLAALAVLFLLYALVRQLPLLRWIVEGAKFVHALGWPGAVATLGAIYLMTLLLLPIIPLIVACGWLYGPAGSIISLTAAVASAATSFSVARALGGAAASQGVVSSPRLRGSARHQEAVDHVAQDGEHRFGIGPVENGGILGAEHGSSRDGASGIPGEVNGDQAPSCTEVAHRDDLLLLRSHEIASRAIRAPPSGPGNWPLQPALWPRGEAPTD